MPFIQKLKERKIPQTLVIYLGGGWVLIEALNFFIEKYGWTAKIFDVFIILVIFGLPRYSSLCLVSWYIRNVKSSEKRTNIYYQRVHQHNESITVGRGSSNASYDNQF